MFPAILIRCVSSTKFWVMHFFYIKKIFSLRSRSNSPSCFFCKEDNETVSHFYFFCPNVRNLRNQLKFYLAEGLTLPPQKLHAAVFGFPEKDKMENAILYNHLFLIFNFTLLFSRKSIFQWYDFDELNNGNKKNRKRKLIPYTIAH